MGDPTKDKQIGISVRSPGGMLRRPSPLILPSHVAFLSENMRHKDELGRRRKGAILLGHYAATNGSIQMDGTTAKYVTFPDHLLYDVDTKWAILGHLTCDGAPASSGYFLSRDVGGGYSTFNVYVNSARKVIAEMYDSANAQTTLTGTTIHALGAAISFAFVRNGTSLALYINGNPTAEATATVSSLSNKAGATKIGLGLTSNDNFASNFTSPLNGKIGFVAIALDWTSVADLLRYSTGMKYANPRDPRFILAAYFSYTKETGAVAKDWSRVANHGTITGSPTRATAAALPPAPSVVQYLAPFYKRSTDELQNIAFIAGDFFKNIVRKGTA